MCLIAIFSISGETRVRRRVSPGEIRKAGRQSFTLFLFCFFFPGGGNFLYFPLRLHLQLPVFRARLLHRGSWIKYNRAKGETSGFAFCLQQWTRIGGLFFVFKLVSSREKCYRMLLCCCAFVSRLKSLHFFCQLKLF